MLWFIFLFLISVAADNDAEKKFKECHDKKCILIQCYFPVQEFQRAARSELKLFENFLQEHHLFISYHLCADLSSDRMDEVGACIYGVLFKLYQFDANLNIHQRIQMQEAQILEESVAVVMDTISRILYGVQSINDTNQLTTMIKDEDTVVIDAQLLTSQVHLEVSRNILNYGQWFSFVYSTATSDNIMIDCLYRIYSPESDVTVFECATPANIQDKLEQRMGTRNDRSSFVKTIFDLTHVNALKRKQSTLFYIHNKSNYNLISNKNMIIIPVKISKLNKDDIEKRAYLRAPYPLYLYWSAKKKKFQRLGDEPSNDVLDSLINDEQERTIKNVYGMFDDEVRHLADDYKDFQINPKVIFLNSPKDYQSILRNHSKIAILFTVKWDATSHLARRTFHQLASDLNSYLTLVDIDCFDWTDVCSLENIVEWPTLAFIENQKITKIYRGSTDKYEMQSALLRFAVNQSYCMEENADTAAIENLLSRQQLIMIAKIQQNAKDLIDVYRKLVDLFSDNENVFFICQYTTKSSDLIMKQKYGDSRTLLKRKVTYYSFFNALEYFQQEIVYGLRTPLVPFDPVEFVKSTWTTFIVASEPQLKLLDEYFLSKGASLENPFVWIDTNSVWVLSINKYGYIPYPAVVYIDFTKGYVYVKTDLKDIDDWLTAIQNDSIKPFYEMTSADNNEEPSQSEIEYYKLMTDDILQEDFHETQQEMEVLNEHGLGFDMNGVPLDRDL